MVGYQQFTLEGGVAAIQGKPTYRCAVQCRSCGQVVGYFSPHVGAPHQAMHAAMREHRAQRGCPERVSAFVITRCSFCPDILDSVVTLSLNGGEWWKAVGHPHDALHGVDRHRHPREGQDWYPDDE